MKTRKTKAGDIVSTADGDLLWLCVYNNEEQGCKYIVVSTKLPKIRPLGYIDKGEDYNNCENDIVRENVNIKTYLVLFGNKGETCEKYKS